MADDADRITRWVIKKSYGIRNPSAAAIARYRYWHSVSRSPGGFAASGPWEHWLSREIPPGAAAEVPLPEPRPPKANGHATEPEPAPAPMAANGAALNERTSRRRDVSKAKPPPKPATTSPRGEVPAKRRGRPPRLQQARALLQEQLASGPKPGALVEAAALEASIPQRSLLSATDKLGVRTQRGQWWLPGRPPNWHRNWHRTARRQ